MKRGWALWIMVKREKRVFQFVRGEPLFCTDCICEAERDSADHNRPPFMLNWEAEPDSADHDRSHFMLIWAAERALWAANLLVFHLVFIWVAGGFGQ